MSDATIYALFDPREPALVRYVGKTEKTMQFRLSRHLAETRLGLKAHRFHWIASLLASGITPAIRLVAKVPASEWQLHERKWIKHYRNAGHPLTNGSNGGDGLDSDAWKRVWSSADLRERQSKSLKAHYTKPEALAKRSRISRQRYENQSEREKTSRISKEVGQRPAVREKRRIATGASWKNPQVRAKRLAGMISSQCTPIARRKSSERFVRMWKEPGRRARASKLSLDRWSDPIVRESIQASMRASHQSPEARKRNSNARKKSWITRRANQSRKIKCA